MASPGKTCSSCKVRKPVEEFATDRHRKSGLLTRCKQCDRERARAYYRANVAKKAAYHAAHRDARVADGKANRDAIRATAARIYGGVCEWCSAAEDLEFDHVDDDGSEHRAEEDLRAMLRRIALTGERLPDRRLRLLCRPCHRGPGWEERRAAHA